MPNIHLKSSRSPIDRDAIVRQATALEAFADVLVPALGSGILKHAIHSQMVVIIKRVTNAASPRRTPAYSRARYAEALDACDVCTAYVATLRKRRSMDRADAKRLRNAIAALHIAIEANLDEREASAGAPLQLAPSPPATVSDVADPKEDATRPVDVARPPVSKPAARDDRSPPGAAARSNGSGRSQRNGSAPDKPG
jgi:hypothetical protein